MAADKIGPPKQLAETNWKFWGINPDKIIMDELAEQEYIPYVEPVAPIKCVNCED